MHTDLTNVLLPPSHSTVFVLCVTGYFAVQLGGRFDFFRRFFIVKHPTNVVEILSRIVTTVENLAKAVAIVVFE